MRTWSLALVILISGVVFAPPVRAINLLDLEQKLAPNTDGNLESESEVFFNWGLFRSGFVYRSEDITKMAVVNGQDLAINIRTRSYDIIALRVQDGGIGDDDFFFAPFIGGCFINRSKKGSRAIATNASASSSGSSSKAQAGCPERSTRWQMNTVQRNWIFSTRSKAAGPLRSPILMTNNSATA